MLKLIVNADDFGLSEKTNEGIRQAHCNGILTSASLMANGAAFEHAVALCREVPTLDIGIHLTLIEERPLLDPRDVPSLVDAQGRFPRHATVFTRLYFQRKLSLKEIRAELDAQFKRILSQGIRISHVDSHQHVHMLPQVLAITVDLARQYGIPIVRFPREAVSSYMWRGKGAFSRVLQSLALRYFCFLGRNSAVSRTDHFAGFFHGGKLDRQNMRKVIGHLPRTGTCELMCHPSVADPSSNYSHWGYRGADELEALTQPTTANLLKQNGITLSSFGGMGKLPDLSTR